LALNSLNDICVHPVDLRLKKPHANMADILIIEDEHALGNALALAVIRLGHMPVSAASGAAALDRLARVKFDAIILDIGLPDISGVEVLTRLRNAGDETPVVVITAHAALDQAIATQKLGIADYLIKPLDLRRFEEVVSSLVSRGVLAHPEPAPPPAVTSLIGAARSMHRVFLDIARACSGDMPVLVSGPCGSGKSLAARVIHYHGARASQAMRRIDCRQIDHESALRDTLADATGTFLLEDLDALDARFQPVLADALAAPAGSHPRLIATLRTTGEGNANSQLTPGIFYAFSAMQVDLPPLHERAGDIPALCRFFHGMLEGHPSPRPLEISAPALCALQAYPWPGNVRELKHVVEHALAMSKGATILPGHLPPHVSAALHDHGASLVSGELESAIARWLDSQMEITPEGDWQYDAFLQEVEATMLRHLLERFDGRPTHLATALRMNRATLRQKIRRFGV